MVNWDWVLSRTRERIGETAFQTWFVPTRLLGNDSRGILLEVPNHFHQLWFSEQYENLIREIVRERSSLPFRIKYRCFDALNPNSRTDGDTLPSLSEPLDPERIFENFITGYCNLLPFKVSLRIATSSRHTYNPFFLHAPLGSGKTHLLHAIANHTVRQASFKNVCYVTADRFCRCAEAYARANRLDEFRSRCSEMDLLLLDDIHRMSSAKRAQGEFVHLFNHLYNHQRQIVVSAETLPRDLPGLNDPLRSRLSWGVMAEISHPSVEIKERIIERKCEREQLPLSPEIRGYLASSEGMNLHLLESSIIRLATYASLSKKPLELREVRTMLEQKQDMPGQDLIHRIQQEVCKYFGISTADMESSKKTRDVSYARQMAMYLVRRLSGEPYSIIAGRFGNKDHTTVIRACQKVERRLRDDSRMQQIFRELKILIHS